jgi:hypothetical protein
MFERLRLMKITYCSLFNASLGPKYAYLSPKVFVNPTSLIAFIEDFFSNPGKNYMLS